MNALLKPFHDADADFSDVYSMLSDAIRKGQGLMFDL